MRHQVQKIVGKFRTTNQGVVLNMEWIWFDTILPFEPFQVRATARRKQKFELIFYSGVIYAKQIDR